MTSPASSDHENTTKRVQRCLNRLEAGDENARSDLIKEAFRRLYKQTEVLSFKFGRTLANDTDDIFQNAVQRLWSALTKITPQTPLEFFGLAARHIRWEIIDAARRLRSLLRIGSVSLELQNSDGVSKQIELADSENEPTELVAWTEMHQKIEELPEKLREVFELKYYFDLTNKEVAEMLNMSEQTVRKRWREARIKLYESLGEFWPKI